MISVPKVLALNLMAFLLIGADTPTPKGYACGRAKVPIVVDGKLDDAAWRLAPWTDDFVDIEGSAKPLPRYRTRAKMTWDANYFYIAAELMEPHVQGTFTKHDSYIFHEDNDFEVFIDPDGDNHEYSELEINARNTVWDLLLEKPYRDGGPAIDAWEVPGLKTATHVVGTLNQPADRDESWTVEFAIPWKGFADRAHRPCPPVDGDRWRVNFSRVEWDFLIEGNAYQKPPDKPETNWVWSPQGVIDMHRPELWGDVLFSDASPGTTNYRPDPDMAARFRLMDVYHAQKAYQKDHQTWATSLEALGVGNLPAVADAGPVTIHPTPKGYQAEITARGGQSPPRTWSIRQDSRLTRLR